MRVLVTRPQPQASAWVALLQQAGLDAAALPLLAMGPAPDPGAVAAAWQRLPQQALVMFVSPHAVAEFFAHAPAGQAWPGHVLAGATGPGTEQALQAAGVPAACVRAPAAGSPRFDTDTLWQQHLATLPWAGTQVLVVRGNGGRDWLADTLRQHGAQVQMVQAYVRGAPAWGPVEQQHARQALAEPAAHGWLLSSSQAAGHLPALLPGADWSASQALASHERIAATARALGFGQVRLVAPGLPALLHALGAGPPPGGLPVGASIESAPDGD